MTKENRRKRERAGKKNRERGSSNIGKNRSIRKMDNSEEATESGEELNKVNLSASID